ncbi:hypothetical protein SK128_011644 [Halocaridina rubra]|uniref:Uncharacterized protein n=1 Tax=Halocaridina rubra TaxID=373956 RepID=A0AAN9FUD4_HALRR
MNLDSDVGSAIAVGNEVDVSSDGVASDVAVIGDIAISSNGVASGVAITCELTILYVYIILDIVASNVAVSGSFAAMDVTIVCTDATLDSAFVVDTADDTLTYDIATLAVIATEDISETVIAVISDLAILNRAVIGVMVAM